MKVSLWVYSSDNGDGSSSPYFFATEEQAEEYMRIEEKNCGYVTDSLSHITLEFDDNGVFLNPDTNEDWSER